MRTRERGRPTMAAQARPRIRGRAVALVVAAGLAVAACGGADDGATPTEPPNEDVAPVDADADEGGSSVVDQVVVLADQAIANLGSDDAATDAILRALDAGYDYDQLRVAIPADQLTADGTIDGVEPVNPAAELVVGIRRTAPPPTPIERIRQRAQELAEDQEDLPIDIVDATGAVIVLQLAALGFTAEQIVAAIVLGLKIDFGFAGAEGRDERKMSCDGAVQRGEIDIATSVFGDCKEWARECGITYSIAGDEPIRPPGCSPEALPQSGDDDQTTSDPPSTDDVTPDEPGDDSTDATEPQDSTPVQDPVDDTVIVVEGELTGGPILDGVAGILEAVTENEVEFVLSFGDGTITGDGIATRRIDGSNESCRFRYVSPLDFDFTGAFDGEERSMASGTFDWLVVAAKADVLELVR